MLFTTTTMRPRAHIVKLPEAISLYYSANITGNKDPGSSIKNALNEGDPYATLNGGAYCEKRTGFIMPGDGDINPGNCYLPTVCTVLFWFLATEFPPNKYLDDYICGSYKSTWKKRGRLIAFRTDLGYTTLLGRTFDTGGITVQRRGQVHLVKDTWYPVAMVCDINSVKIYINAVLDIECPANTYSIYPFCFGGIYVNDIPTSSSARLVGGLDHLAIAPTTALTVEEIIAYNDATLKS